MKVRIVDLTEGQFEIISDKVSETFGLNIYNTMRSEDGKYIIVLEGWVNNIYMIINFIEGVKGE